MDSHTGSSKETKSLDIVDGVLAFARQLVSPNYDSRPAEVVPDLLVVHSISLPPAQYGGDGVEQLFTNRLDENEHPYYKEIAALEVSAHLYIRRDGEIIQFVNFDCRAWHAGQSCYEGRERCNDYSIGIELEGTDSDIFTEAQYQSLASSSLALLRYYPAMTKERITGHQNIAPNRKTDPGSGFDWDYYRSIMNRQ